MPPRFPQARPNCKKPGSLATFSSRRVGNRWNRFIRPWVRSTAHRRARYRGALATAAPPHPATGCASWTPPAPLIENKILYQISGPLDRQSILMRQVGSSTGGREYIPLHARERRTRNRCATTRKKLGGDRPRRVSCVGEDSGG
jgi:hypothetical protein